MNEGKLSAIRLRDSSDVAVLLGRYQRGIEGLGLGLIRELVMSSELPNEVKRKFMLQFASGQIFPEDFLE
jgi:hypothetical protein